MDNITVWKGGETFKSMSPFLPGKDPEEEQICYYQSLLQCDLVSSPFAEVWQVFIKPWHLVTLVSQLPCLSEVLLLTRASISLSGSQNTCIFGKTCSRKFPNGHISHKLFCFCCVWTFLTGSKVLIWRKNLKDWKFNCTPHLLVAKKHWPSRYDTLCNAALPWLVED